MLSVIIILAYMKKILSLNTILFYSRISYFSTNIDNGSMYVLFEIIAARVILGHNNNNIYCFHAIDMIFRLASDIDGNMHVSAQNKFPVHVPPHKHPNGPYYIRYYIDNR